ncbi:hypothetical protein BH09MYX1_BH09MYX1_44150 [soil metagenome]
MYVSDSGSTVNIQSEQSAIVAHQAGGDVLLVAYNDLNTSPAKSINGLATSSVIGSGGTPVTWPTRTLLAPSGPFTVLSGDPWLVASSRKGGTVYYASIGVTAAGIRAAVARSDDGGATFGTFVAAPTTPPCSVGVDKESVDTSANGKDVWVAYRCDNGGPAPFSIRLAHSSDQGVSWTDALVASLPLSDVGVPSPVVKRDPARETNVFVTWEEDTNTSARRTIRFAASSDSGTTFGPSTAAVDVPKSPDPVFDGFTNAVQNLVHFSFEIDPSNDHCIIAYDLNGSVFFKGSADGVSWSAPTTIASDSTTERFQPFLRGTPTYLAVSYYAQPSSGPNVKSTVVGGRLSGDHGATWSAAQHQLSFVGGGFATDGFQACAQPGSGFFGDYIGETPLWAPWQPYNDTLARRFYSFWADSRPSCIVQSGVTAIHQHTVGQLWGL